MVWLAVVYSPTSAGIDERGVILTIPTPSLSLYTIHLTARGSVGDVYLSKHVAHEYKVYNGGDTHYSPRDPRL